MQDDLKARVAALRAAGKSDQEIARTLQDERNAAKSAGTPAKVSAMPTAASESTTAHALPNRVGPDAPEKFLSGTARAAAQGLTFGFADELEGAVRGALGPRSVSDEIDDVRAENKRFKSLNPGTAFAAEMAGGFLPIAKVGSGIKAGAKTIGLGRSMAQGAKVGAGFGALAGAGTTDDSGSFMDRLGQRAEGATVGGLFGGAIGGAAPAVLAGGARLADEFSPFTDRLKASLQGVMQSRAGAVGVGGQDEALLAALRSRGPEAVPTKQEAAALAREHFGSFGRAEKRALRVSEKRAGDLEGPLRQVSGLDGRPVVAADLLGESSQRLFGTAQNMENPARQEAVEFLADRGRGRGERLASDVSKATKTEPINLTTHADDIRQGEAAAIESGFEAANTSGTRVPLSGTSKRVIQSPEGQKAVTQATKVNREAQVARGRAPLDEFTDEATDLSLETVDGLKKALDDRIRELEASPGASGDMLASLKANRAALVNDADAASPAYKRARGLFAETEKRAEAVATGKKLGQLKGTSDEITQELIGLSPLEEEEVRRAAAQQMREEVTAPEEAGINRILRPGKDKRVTALFGKAEADDLAGRTALERSMRDTEKAGGNSMTFGRGEDKEALLGGGFNPAKPWSSLKDMALNKAIEKVSVGGPEVAAAVTKIQAGGRLGPEELRRSLQLLAGVRSREANLLAQRLRVAAVGGRMAGGQ